MKGQRLETGWKTGKWWKRYESNPKYPTKPIEILVFYLYFNKVPKLRLFGLFYLIALFNVTYFQSKGLIILNNETRNGSLSKDKIWSKILWLHTKFFSK